MEMGQPFNLEAGSQKGGHYFCPNCDINYIQQSHYQLQDLLDVGLATQDLSKRAFRHVKKSSPTAGHTRHWLGNTSTCGQCQAKVQCLLHLMMTFLYVETHVRTGSSIAKLTFSAS